MKVNDLVTANLQAAPIQYQMVWGV